MNHLGDRFTLVGLLFFSLGLHKTIPHYGARLPQNAIGSNGTGMLHIFVISICLIFHRQISGIIAWGT